MTSNRGFQSPSSGANILLRELRSGGEYTRRTPKAILEEYTVGRAPYPRNKDSAREYLRMDADGLYLLGEHAITVSTSCPENINYKWILQAYRILKMPYCASFNQFRSHYCTEGNANFWENYLDHIAEIDKSKVRKLTKPERQICKDIKWLNKERNEQDGEGYSHYGHYKMALDTIEMMMEEECDDEAKEEKRKEKERAWEERVRAKKQAKEAREAEERQQELHTAAVATDEAKAGEKRAREDSPPQTGDSSKSAAKRQKQDPEATASNIVEATTTTEPSEKVIEDQATLDAIADAEIEILAAEAAAAAAKAARVQAARAKNAEAIAAADAIADADVESDEETADEEDQELADTYASDDEFWIEEDPDVCFEEMEKGGFRVLMRYWVPSWER
ncbi:MAG: hypothetical protein Q9212_007092 [Teloschistes hypoglaucus]